MCKQIEIEQDAFTMTSYHNGKYIIYDEPDDLEKVKLEIISSFNDKW